MTGIKKGQGRQVKNQVENLKENRGSVLNQLPLEDPLEILQEILGTTKMQPESKKEFKPGESIDIGSILGIKKEAASITPKTLENRFLFAEERKETERKIATLRYQLKEIIKEIKALATSTKAVEEEIRTIPENPPQEPGVYHIGFFEEILKLIKNARTKIEEASVCLSLASARAKKKNYWARYKKGGASFLLSPDHYLTRSAG